MQSSAFLCDAAVAAGHELGVFEALRSRGDASVGELAEELGVAGRRRLRALLDVLAALGAIQRQPWRDAPDAAERGGAGPRFAQAARVPPCPVVARAGWGLLAEVIRSDQPLPAESDAGAVRRLHRHLAAAGAEAARELVAMLDGTSLLDLGAGAGAYSRAFLEAHPAGAATLVDRGEVLALAAEHLGPLAARARFVEGDAAIVELGAGHGAVLLANLLHLHSDGMCARLCGAAADAVAPGGVVAIKDLRVDDDRRGPIDGLLFALNMALYTEGGDVYSTGELRAWLRDAGLVDITEHRLATAPDAIVVLGRRPHSDGATPGTTGNAGGPGGAPRGGVPTRVRSTYLPRVADRRR
jgi:O-methyltransferase